MKAEACPFEQCRFSKVCNHIHCIRPQCNYVLHSSGQLYSHKRKHERNDSEIAYRKYKQGTPRPPGSWSLDESLPGHSLSMNGESSSEGRGSPAFYSLDDSFQSASDLAMDLTSGGGAMGLLGDMSLTQQLSPAELACTIAAQADCGCGFGQVHHHCVLDRCGATLRDIREIREHLREHEAQERITDTFFEEGNCDEGCPYENKERHYHCTWENCREIILATDKPFRRLQHYKIHEYSRQLDLTTASQPLSSDVTLTHLTNIDAMFRRKRGRPPKNRVIEIWSGADGAAHPQDSPQAIFASFKLPKPSATVSNSTSIDEGREGSLSPSTNDPVGFSTYNNDSCPDLSCGLRHTRHHHCSQPRCYFATNRPDQLLMHSKDFHDNVEIPPGFAFYDQTIDCRLPGCVNNRQSKHFHCTRPNCGYSFLRYLNMPIHEKQHSAEELSVAGSSSSQQSGRENQTTPVDMKPRIQVKKSAELIDKLNESGEESVRTQEHKDAGISSPEINKTTGMKSDFFIVFRVDLHLFCLRVIFIITRTLFYNFACSKYYSTVSLREKKM